MVGKSLDAASFECIWTWRCEGAFNDEVHKMCEKLGFVVEKLEEQKEYRMHLVARKKI